MTEQKKRQADIFRLREKPGDQVALWSDNNISVTYGELLLLCEEMGTICPQRCLIFCMCKNEPGAIVGYLGALGNDIVPLLLDANLGQKQLEAFYVRYRPAYIWAPLNQRPDTGVCHEKPMYTACQYGLWKTEFAPYPMHSDLALLLATSGSTGDPKLVRLSLTNLLANAASICTYLHLDETERPITTLPMHYSYGLSVINSHLLAGACVLLTTASYVQAEFWNFLAEHQATSFSGVPYTYEILKKIHLFQMKIPSLRMITQAGGKLPESLWREVYEWTREQDILFYVMYGQTEATARMGYVPPERCLEKIGSIGISIPGGTFSLEDDNGNEIQETDCVGELVYQGDNVSQGYASQAADLLLGDEREGHLLTGDLARRDSDGYYYLVGRKKRFIKIFGVRVSLDACEQMLREQYPELELACSGEDDHLCVYAVGDAENLASELASRLRLNRKGFEGIAVEEIPKNSAGKILYAKLK